MRQFSEEVLLPVFGTRPGLVGQDSGSEVAGRLRGLPREKQAPAYAGCPWALRGGGQLGPFGEAPPFWPASSPGAPGPAPQPSRPSLISGPSWCEQGPLFSAASAAAALPACGHVGCVFSCARSGLCVREGPTLDSQPGPPAIWVRLSPRRAGAGERKWKVAFSWPSLQARGSPGNFPRPAGSQPGPRSGRQHSLCSTPAGGEGCCGVGRAGKGAWPGLQRGLGLQSVARGLAAHRCPFPGVLGEKGQHVCQAQAQLQPTRAGAGKPSLPGPRAGPAAPSHP